MQCKRASSVDGFDWLSLFWFRVFCEFPARLVEGQRVRQSPNHDNDPGGSKCGKRLNGLRTNVLDSSFEHDRADIFQREQPPSETQPGLVALKQLYRSDREEDVNAQNERDAEIIQARLVPYAERSPYAERGAISEQANSGNRYPEQNKHPEQRINLPL
jgi:hypothetical protein